MEAGGAGEKSRECALCVWLPRESNGNAGGLLELQIGFAANTPRRTETKRAAENRRPRDSLPNARLQGEKQPTAWQYDCRIGAAGQPPPLNPHGINGICGR
jgi:hypothetical protein